jgi:mono/diheme cytochrome c family protein
VVDTLKKASDADLHAMATYVASLNRPPDADRRAQAALDFAQSRAVKVTAAPVNATTGAAPTDHAPSGAEIFSGACAGCHHEGGTLPISRPVALALTTPVNAPEATDFLRIVLNGIHPPLGERGTIMPAFDGTLTDAQIVALASYVRAHYSRQPAWTGIDGQLKSSRENPQPKPGNP